MNTPLTCAQLITQNDPQHADPLLDFLLWAVKPDTPDSAEYDAVLDFLCARVPEFRIWREEHVKQRAA